jgi:hypothetical protein
VGYWCEIPLQNKSNYVVSRCFTVVFHYFSRVIKQCMQLKAYSARDFTVLCSARLVYSDHLQYLSRISYLLCLIPQVYAQHDFEFVNSPVQLRHPPRLQTRETLNQTLVEAEIYLEQKKPILSLDVWKSSSQRKARRG